MFNTNRYSYYEVSRFFNPFFYNVGRYIKKTDEYVLNVINEQTGREYLDYSEGQKDVTSST